MTALRIVCVPLLLSVLLNVHQAFSFLAGGTAGAGHLLQGGRRSCRLRAEGGVGDKDGEGDGAGVGFGPPKPPKLPKVHAGPPPGPIGVGPKAPKKRVRPPVDPEGPCPCSSGDTYGNCCQSYHDGVSNCPDPLSLLRSRYSAYHLGLSEFIMDTTHPSNEEWRRDRTDWRKSIDNFCNFYMFPGLNVKKVIEISASSGYVEFEALVEAGGKNLDHFERSLFVREGEGGGVWFYEGELADMDERVVPDSMFQRRMGPGRGRGKPKHPLLG